MRQTIADHHRYAKTDRRAANFFSNLERYGKISRMFTWIRVFVWLVGIGTLLAGIVGVSNIMLISVKERTQEIGIRKAIGATPGSIVRMIVAESLLITGIAGYVGLAAGIGAVSLAATYLPSMKYLRDPSVNFNVALGATVLIVVAGTLAGLFPARQAASTHPITALRTE
jgi:putative ABC transport system permease protein